MSPEPAAVRAFRIPEIFEQIVLAAIRSAIASNTQYARLEPIETLNCLRRINHASNNGILKSPMIRKCMHVNALPWQYTVVRGDRNYIRPALAALEWLFKSRLGWPIDLWVKLDDSKIKQLKIGFFALSKEAIERIQNFRMKKDGGRAPWRAVPLVGQHKVAAIVLKSFEVHFRSCALPPHKYVERATFDGDVTLGEVADWFFDVASRSEEEHLRVLEEKQSAGLNWLDGPED